MKIKVEVSWLEALTKFNCDHVIWSGNDEAHCDKNDNDLKRGACCNSCWARRGAEAILRHARIYPRNNIEQAEKKARLNE